MPNRRFDGVPVQDRQVPGVRELYKHNTAGSPRLDIEPAVDLKMDQTQNASFIEN